MNEHALQCEMLATLQLQTRPRMRIASGLIYAIPNGGHRNAITARKMKAEGVRAGMPDLCLPMANGDAHGLYIEVKTKTGTIQKNQRAMHELLRAQGYRVEVVRSVPAFIQLIADYLSV